MSPLTKYVARQLIGSPLLTGLTVATMIVVGFVVSVETAIIVNLRVALRAAGHPERVMVMKRGATDESESEVTSDAVREIGVAPGVRSVSPEQLFETMVSGEFVLGRALTENGFAISGMQLRSGRMPGNGERELLVGEALVMRHPELAVGAKLRVGRSYFPVVGTFRTGSSRDSEVWSSRDAVSRELRAYEPSIVIIETASADDAKALVKFLDHRLERWKLRPLLETEQYEMKVSHFRRLDRILTLIIVLLIVGTSMGAASTFGVALRRRVGDMSVLRAIGFRTGRVVWMMLLEAEVSAVGGTVIGAALAYLTLHDYSAYLNDAGMYLTFRMPVTPLIAAASVLIGTLIGAVGAAWPIALMVRTSTRDGLAED